MLKFDLLPSPDAIKERFLKLPSKEIETLKEVFIQALLEDEVVRLSGDAFLHGKNPTAAEGFKRSFAKSKLPYPFLFWFNGQDRRPQPALDVTGKPFRV